MVVNLSNAFILIPQCKSALISRTEMQQISRKGEPEEADTHQHKDSGLKLAPDSLTIPPGLNRVIEHQHGSNRSQNANDLYEVKPHRTAIAKDVEVRQSVNNKTSQCRHKQQV